MIYYTSHRNSNESASINFYVASIGLRSWSTVVIRCGTICIVEIVSTWCSLASNWEKKFHTGRHQSSQPFAHITPPSQISNGAWRHQRTWYTWEIRVTHQSAKKAQCEYITAYIRHIASHTLRCQITYKMRLPHYKFYKAQSVFHTYILYVLKAWSLLALLVVATVD